MRNRTAALGRRAAVALACLAALAAAGCGSDDEPARSGAATTSAPKQFRRREGLPAAAHRAARGAHGSSRARPTATTRSPAPSASTTQRCCATTAPR
jgi:hypothetical protein